MEEYTLEGSYYDIGLSYGRAIAHVQLDSPSERIRTFLQDAEPYLRESVPSLLDEFHGIADGGGFTLSEVMAVPVALPNDSLCSAVAISGEHTGDGHTLFGRNYDYFQSFEDYAELYRTHPQTGQASIGCSDHWVGRHDGVNESGLAVAITWVANNGYEPGVTFPLAVRHILDTCSSVEEAVSFLSSIHHARNTNFLVADPTGDIAVVEASPDKTTVRRPAEGIGIITNHYTSTEMEDYEVVRERPADSNSRYQTLSELAAIRSDLTIEDIRSVLADAEDGVCAYDYGAIGDPVVTLWSLTADLNTSRIEIADGPPNKNQYRQIELRGRENIQKELA